MRADEVGPSPELEGVLPAAARRARDAAVRALPIARVAERLEAGEHAAERAALCARAVEARAVVLEGEHLDAPRCERLRARGLGLGLGSARTRVRVRVRVYAHEGALLLRGLGSCAAPCAQRVRVRVRVRVGVLRGALEHEGVHAVGVHLEHVHALDAPRRHERVDGGRL